MNPYRLLPAFALLFIGCGELPTDDPSEPEMHQIDDHELVRRRVLGNNGGAQAAEPGGTFTRHRAVCEDPEPGRLSCDEPVTDVVRLGGVPNLSAFCGRAKPWKTYVFGGTLYVLWRWTVTPVYVPAGTTMAKVNVGGCEGTLRNHSGAFSYGGSMAQWTSGQFDGCGAVSAGDAVSIEYL